MNNTERFPPAWDERMMLDLREIDLQDPEALQSYEKMAAKRGKTAFLDLFARTQSRLPKLIAVVRKSVFNSSGKVFADEMGLSGHGYSSMEKDLEGRQPQFHPYHLLLHYWKERGISQGVRDQCLDLLTFPDLFEQKNPKKNRKYDPQPTLLEKIEEVRSGALGILDNTHVTAFYHRIGFEIGHPNVAKRFPKFWNKLWQREKTGTVPIALELLDVIQAMYAGEDDASTQLRALRMAEGKALWSEAKKTQYRVRGIEEPLSELLAKMEMDLAENFEWHIGEGQTEIHEGMTLTAEALREVYDIPNVSVQSLIQCELVDWDDIKTVAARVIDSQSLVEFEERYGAACVVEKGRIGFPSEVQRAMKERGFNYRMLYDLLVSDAKAEDTNETVADDNEVRNRPENVIRHIIHDNAQSSVIAIESLLRMLARDEAHYGELRGFYAAERGRYFKRIGNRLDGEGLQMRIHRELANMSMEELACHFLPKTKTEDKTAVRQKALELQKLERNELKDHPISFGRVFKILSEAIEERKEEAAVSLQSLNEFPEALKNWTTVQELAEHCVKGMKSAAYVAEAMEKYASADSPDCLRQDLVLDVASGKFVPPLRCLRVMAQGVAEKTLTSDVVLDWHERFPQQLKEGCQVFSPTSFQKPLARFLCTMIGSLDSNVIDFFRRRVEGLRDTHGTQLIRAIDEGHCDESNWVNVRKILLGAGLKSGSIQWQFAELLFRNGQNVDAALEELVPRMQRQGIEINSQHFPGMMPKELLKYCEKQRSL